MKTYFFFALILVCGLQPLSTAFASPEGATETNTESIAELYRRLEVLSAEIEALKDADTFEDPAELEAPAGLAEGASSVYKKASGVSIAGYGEAKYTNYRTQDESGAASGKKDYTDLHRVIMYLGYRFNENFVFNSEIEFEHIDELAVEFAYIDWFVNSEFSLRAGHMLVPMGILNELHEPTTYFGVNRNKIEKEIIPTTWHENGIGFTYGKGPFSLRSYVLAGMDITGFSSAGIRGGRQQGSKSLIESVGGVARIDYAPMDGLDLGASAYAGGSAQGATDPANGKTIRAMTYISELHFQYTNRGFKTNGLVAYTRIKEAAAINRALGLTGASGVGSSQLGYYFDLGYDVLTEFDTDHSFSPFVRFEGMNKHLRVPTGYTADPSLDEIGIIAGFNYKPIDMVVFKGDYEYRSNKAGTGVSAGHAGIGFIF